MPNFFKVPEKALRDQSYLTFLLTLTWTVVVGTMVIFGFYFFPENWQRWTVFSGILVFLPSVILTAIHLGYPRMAAWMLTGMVWLFVTLPCFSEGGILAPGILSQLSVILTASILFGWRGGLLIGLATVGVDLWMVYLEVSGLLPTPSVAHTPITRWIGTLIPIATIFALQYFASNRFFDGLSDLSQKIGTRKVDKKGADESVFNLNERAKKLKTLYKISRILLDKENTQERLVSKISEELIEGLRFPSLATACITIGHQSFASPGFDLAEALLSVELQTKRKTKVSIDVSYPQTMPDLEKGAFAEEELEMINTLIDMITSSWDQREHILELEDLKYVLDIATMVSVTDSDDKFTYINESFCKISQYSVEELHGIPCDILRSGVHSEGYFDEQKKSIQNGIIFRGEFCNRAKDGSLYWVDATIVPFLDSSGNVFRVLSINYDITELKRSAEKLRESEERFRSIVEVAKTGAWEFHTDTRKVWYSTQYFAMLGKELKDPIWEVDPGPNWLERIHPEDRAKSFAHFEEFLKDESGSLYDSTIRMQHQNGDWVWVWARARRLQDQNGNITPVVVGAHIDITKRIKAEERVIESERLLKKIASHAPGNTFMFEIGEGGVLNILFMSRGTDSSDDSISVEEVIKNPEIISDFLFEEDRKMFYDTMKEAQENRAPINLQFRLLVNGVVFWRWLNATSEKDINGKIVWYGATTDITPLVDYIASVEQMIFDIGHVIRKPLSTMLGLTQIIQSEDQSIEETRELSKHLHQISEEMDLFIRELNEVYQQKRENSELKIDISSLVDKRDSLFS